MNNSGSRARWPYILLVVPPLLMILGYYLHHRESNILARMDSTVGEVRKSEVYSQGHGESTTYHLDLEYRYTVDERDFIGRKIGMANIMYEEKQDAMDALARFPVGKELQVLFDPEDPGLAVLTREEPDNGLMTMTMAGILLLFLWPVAFLFLWQDKKNRAS